MDLKQLGKDLKAMLYEVFGDLKVNEVIVRDKFLVLPWYSLHIYKNNGSFRVCHDGAERLNSEDPLKVLWHIGEEIAKIRIYAATVSG